MAAGNYDIVIDQGSDFAIQLQISADGSNVNLTNQSARAQLRPTATSSTLTETFTCSVVSITEGKIRVALTNSETSAISPGKYYYDVELVNAGTSTVTRLIQGIARVTAEVTR